MSVVHPDVGRDKGITELWKIAAMASAERVGFAPHNAAGPVMTHVVVHVDATALAFMLQKTFEEWFRPDWSDDLLVDSLAIVDGSMEVPDWPGPGVKLDKSVLRERVCTDR